MSYKLQFIDSTRFMACSLSNFVHNLAEGTHETKCKYRHVDKKCKTCGIKYKDCQCYIIDDLIEYKCLCYHKKL